jgi:superfamily I DNA/RNA helicase
MARDYKREYATYQGTEEQKKKRAQRNKARRRLLKEGKVHKGDGMDVAHVKAFDKGGVRMGTVLKSKALQSKTVLLKEMQNGIWFQK